MVGFSLGLVGGGGSILAVPLLVYLVGVSDPHVAIGTSAIAVAANAAANLANHARAGNVKWRCASVFAVAGVAGAFLGSTLGKIVEGQKLLALFAIVMMVVAALMLKGRSGEGEANLSELSSRKVTIGDKAREALVHVTGAEPTRKPLRGHERRPALAAGVVGMNAK